MDDVERAGFQRLDGEGALRVGHRHEDHARRFRHRRERAEHAEAVELGHLQVERDDVRLQLLDPLECVDPVARDADDLDPAVPRQHLAHHLARERRVVDDEDAIAHGRT